MKTITKLWIFILILAVMSPIGLILPGYFKSKSAWGEWGPNEMKEMIGYIPAGFSKLASLWCAPIPDYAFRNWESKSLFHLGISYAISAIIGIMLIVGIVFILGRFLNKKDNDQ